MLTCTRLRRLEAAIKDLKSAREADLQASSSLFIRMHNVEQQIACPEQAASDINLTATYMLGYHAGKDVCVDELNIPWDLMRDYMDAREYSTGSIERMRAWYFSEFVTRYREHTHR